MYHQQGAYQPSAPTSQTVSKGSELVLEHALGFSARQNNLTFCGTGPANFSTVSSQRVVEAPVIAYGCGKVVVLSNLDDPHSQKLLNGNFNSPITCLDKVYSAAQSVSHTSRVGESRMEVIATGHSASADGICYVNLWDAAYGQIIRTIPTAHRFVASSVTNQSGGNGPVGGGYITCVRFSPDGLLFATTGSDGSVCVYECAGATKIGYFKDVIANDEASSIYWSLVQNSGTRDQRYVFAVPFTSGVRLFTLQFSVKSLSYEMRMDPCHAPGGGGRTGGFQRKYLCVTQLEDDLLCGCSTGELVVFNARSGHFRACITVCHGGVTGVVAAPNYQCAFVCGGDGSVKRLVGRDTEWQIAQEVLLGKPSSAQHQPLSYTAPLRCVAMAINHEENGDQIVVSTTSGAIYRLLCSDLTYTIAKEGPLRAVTAIAVKNPSNSVGTYTSSTPPSALSSYVATCSADGAVRLWSLDEYQIVGTFVGYLPTGASTAANPQPFANTSRHNNNNGIGRSQGAIGGGGNGFNDSMGGRAMGSRFGDSVSMGGAGANANNTNTFGGGNNNYSTMSGAAPFNTTSNNFGGAYNGANNEETIVPTCAVFDSHGDPNTTFVVVTGWSDGKVRCIDFSQCVQQFERNGHQIAGGVVAPVLSYELPNVHKGPVTAIDVCQSFLATGGSDAVVRVWSNPPPLSPQEIQEQQNTVYPPNNGHGMPPLPQNHHQQRVVLADINAHRGPITSIKIDNASFTLLHTCSTDMSHKVFDLQDLALGPHGTRGRPDHNGTIGGGSATLTGGFASVGPNGRGGVTSNAMPVKCVRSHEVAHCSGFLSMTQRNDREHEIIVGSGDGQLLFFDLDVGARPVAAIVDKNKVPVVAVDIWSPIVMEGNSDSASKQQRLGVGLADGSVLVYNLSQGTASGAYATGYNTQGPAINSRRQQQEQNPYGGRNNTVNNNHLQQQQQGAEEQGITLAFHAYCHSGAVTSLRWAPDGKQLFSAGAQGEFYVWNFFEH